MKITARVLRMTIYEHHGLTVTVETVDGEIGGTISVRATRRGRARARKLEALLQSRRATGSRGDADDYFYWWAIDDDTGTMPAVDEILPIIEGARAP